VPGALLAALSGLAAGCAGDEARRMAAPMEPAAESPLVPESTDDVSPDPEPSQADGANGDGAMSDLAQPGGEIEVAPSEGDDGEGEVDEAAPEDDEQPPAPLLPLRVFIAGDSTVQTYADTPSPSDQAGWGQMIGALLAERVSVDNRAIGGRTARRFIDEGRLDAIFEDIAAGDYLLVQFGTNDGNRTATYSIGNQTIPYFLDPATEFKEYLGRYLSGAEERGAIPVLVTPPPRNSAYCTGGNGTGGHAQAMRELGDDEGVPVLDLNSRSVEYLRVICPAPTPEDFFLLRADGTVDGTHFQENGARTLARLVSDEARAAGLPLFAPIQ
jgi:lysophospholipase L1-like esterase